MFKDTLPLPGFFTIRSFLHALNQLLYYGLIGKPELRVKRCSKRRRTSKASAREVLLHYLVLGVNILVAYLFILMRYITMQHHSQHDDEHAAPR